MIHYCCVFDVINSLFYSEIQVRVHSARLEGVYSIRYTTIAPPILYIREKWERSALGLGCLKPEENKSMHIEWEAGWYLEPRSEKSLALTQIEGFLCQPTCSMLCIPYKTSQICNSVPYSAVY